jgi:hypothetical protein
MRRERRDLHGHPGIKRQEALDCALGHVTGFCLSSLAEYCGADERHGGSVTASSSGFRSAKPDNLRTHFACFFG